MLYAISSVYIPYCGWKLWTLKSVCVGVIHAMCIEDIGGVYPFDVVVIIVASSGDRC